MHSHTRAGVAVSAVPGGLRPLTQHAGSVLATLALHPYQDSTAVADEGALLVRDLGQNYAMLLENHGLLVVGRTAAEAFVYHYYLEMACRMQVDILSQTASPIEITPEALEPLITWGTPGNEPKGAVQWPALLRMLEREHPGFRE
jgi:ribulose-5-phosphate 4-epimerase/fuculose-1-phosphate aldolase